MPGALDDGPFFHGTVAQLGPGDVLTAGRRSNYRPEVVMNHVYFTALVDGAGLAAEIAAELQPGGATPRVYRVAPTGAFENDPNVTDKKFPGNPTRSYRSSAPLRVLAEVDGWTRLTPEALQAWRARLKVLLSDEQELIINERAATRRERCGSCRAALVARRSSRCGGPDDRRDAAPPARDGGAAAELRSTQDSRRCRRRRRREESRRCRRSRRTTDPEHWSDEERHTTVITAAGGFTPPFLVVPGRQEHLDVAG